MFVIGERIACFWALGALIFSHRPDITGTGRPQAQEAAGTGQQISLVQCCLCVAICRTTSVLHTVAWPCSLVYPATTRVAGECIHNTALHC